MSSTDWIVDKLNAAADYGSFKAAAETENVVFVERDGRPSTYIGVVHTPRGNATPVVQVDEAKNVRSQESRVAMLVAIPRGARWSGDAMRWLASEAVAYGGVGDLLSALVYDDDISTHRNKTLAFVDDGLRCHSRVESLRWIDSRKVAVNLSNGSAVTVALDDAYDITMNVAREASRVLGKFEVLLKTNPNGSITSNGLEQVERLGFQTLKWGELFGYLARQSR